MTISHRVIRVAQGNGNRAENIQVVLDNQAAEGYYFETTAPTGDLRYIYYIFARESQIDLQADFVEVKGLADVKEPESDYDALQRILAEVGNWSPETRTSAQIVAKFHREHFGPTVDEVPALNRLREYVVEQINVRGTSFPGDKALLTGILHMIRAEMQRVVDEG